MTNPEIREQLSALIDNELDRDRARFLLKRAEHDGELVALWQRWHFVGEAMRGAALPLRKDFARSIAERLDEETVAAPVVPRYSHALRWGGGFAVAASVALAALLLTRPDATLSVPVTGNEIASQPAPATDVAGPSVVAPSPYREQDLRPPYRFDAQTVSAQAGRFGAQQIRFDPANEAYWLRHQQAVSGRTGETIAPWLAPLRTDVAEPSSNPH
ncbi:sigma-E factor negative regulatory protein [Xanthomonadaceae bacterium JHOS43]|nr:sigma-E factor negative regulatory protein [Xanthomonadaceae bacterium JHOS43]MCX7564377.1 sigma-E factor negative regulatory protein [Xanthomonadaceae bacterium XH05]